MIFSQFLSMLWKRFDSCGSCLAMSPDVKTASRYIHIDCTWIHCSRTSLIVEKRVIQLCTSSRKAAMYRDAIIEPSATSVSSSRSISSVVSAPLSEMGPRDLKAANASCSLAHSSEMAVSFCSICSSFTAELAMSSTSSWKESSPASSRLISLNESEPTARCWPVTAISCDQWRERIAGCASICTSGSDCRKSSIVLLSWSYASHSRSSLGIRAHCAWNSLTLVAICSIRAETSDQPIWLYDSTVSSVAR